MLNIYLANLGKYNEGKLVGEWLELPATREEYLDLLARIQIDGQRYEEVAIHDYDSDTISTANFGEYESIDELNYLATRLEGLTQDELIKIAVLTDWESPNPADTLRLIDGLDECEILAEVGNEYDLGYYYVEESGIYDPSQLGPLARYIDYEAFGRDIRLDEAGTFTRYGYLGRYEFGNYTDADIDQDCIITRDPESPKAGTSSSPLGLAAAAYPQPVAAGPNPTHHQPVLTAASDDLGKSEDLQR